MANSKKNWPFLFLKIIAKYLKKTGCFKTFNLSTKQVN